MRETRAGSRRIEFSAAENENITPVLEMVGRHLGFCSAHSLQNDANLS